MYQGRWEKLEIVGRLGPAIKAKFLFQNVSQMVRDEQSTSPRPRHHTDQLITESRVFKKLLQALLIQINTGLSKADIYRNKSGLLMTS